MLQKAKKVAVRFIVSLLVRLDYMECLDNSPAWLFSTGAIDALASIIYDLVKIVVVRSQIPVVVPCCGPLLRPDRKTPQDLDAVIFYGLAAHRQ
jgi:hypothetical protein